MTSRLSDRIVTSVYLRIEIYLVLLNGIFPVIAEWINFDYFLC